MCVIHIPLSLSLDISKKNFLKRGFFEENFFFHFKKEKKKAKSPKLHLVATVSIENGSRVLSFLF